MKWWYMKRFVTEQVAASYEYVFAVDEDSDTKLIDVQDFVAILRKNRIAIAQPAMSEHSSSINHGVTQRQTLYDVCLESCR